MATDVAICVRNAAIPLLFLLVTGCGEDSIYRQTNRPLWLIQETKKATIDGKFEHEYKGYAYTTEDEYEGRNNESIFIPKGTSVIVVNTEGHNLQVVTEGKPRQIFLVGEEWIDE